MEDTEKFFENVQIREEDIESIARALLPCIRKFYGSEEGKILLEKWRAESKKTDKEKRGR